MGHSTQAKVRWSVIFCDLEQISVAFVAKQLQWTAAMANEDRWQELVGLHQEWWVFSRGGRGLRTATQATID